MIVGSIVIGLSAQTDKLTKGLNRGAASIQGFAKSVGSYLTAPIGRAEQLISNIGGKLLGFAESIDKTGDAADRLGTTTAALAELRYATQLTGSEAENLDGALTKMGNALSDAAIKGGPAADALKTLGLDANELLKLDPVEQFKRISGGFGTIGNAAQRTSLAMDLFGKSGASLLNTLSAGPAEIEKFSGEFRKLGGSVSESQRQTVGAMFDSFDRLKAAAAGVGTGIAVKLAPAISGAAEKLGMMLKEGTSGGGLLSGVIDRVSSLITTVIDKADRLKPLFTVAFEAAVGGINLTLWALEKLSDFLGPVARQLEKIRGDTAGIGGALGGAFAAFKKALPPELADPAAKKAGAPVAGQTDAAKKLSEKIAEMEKSLQSEVATFGRTGHAAELYKLKLEGATDAQLARAKALADEKQALDRAAEATKKYAEDAHAIFEEARSPLDLYEESIRKIDRALKGGAIDEETADRAKGKAGKDLGLDDHKFAGAMQLGSQEARNAILAATTGRSEGFKVVEKNTAAANGYLRQIADAVRGRPSDSEWGFA